MDPILIGYCAKKVAKRPDWLKVAHVEEICSAGNCVSDAPAGWHEFNPKRNAMWLNQNEEAAINSIVEPENSSDFEIFAYKIFTIAFNEEATEILLTKQETKTIEAAKAASNSVPLDYEFQGYDCIVWSDYGGFGCSPLSCNSMAEEINVNSRCLLDTLESAIETMKHFEKKKERPEDEVEPGPYFIVEVWRKRRSSPSP